jgi:hypothetical protein
MTLAGTIIENIAEVWEAILEQWRRTIHDVCDIVKLFDIVKLLCGTCQQILLNELIMRCGPLPRLPSNDLKEHHAVCAVLKEWAEKHPNFISTTITGN